MLNKYSILLSSVLAGFFAFSAGAAQFRDEATGIEFNFDDTLWEKADVPGEAQKNSVEKTLLSFQRKTADDQYRARFSVVEDNLSKFAKGSVVEQLLAYRKHAQEFLESQRFHIVSVEAANLPKVSAPAFEIIAYQRDFGLTFRQVVVMKDKKAYLLTAATRTKTFDKHKEELDRFFDTFTWSKTP